MTALNISGRDNFLARSIALDAGPALNDQPLVVLVNRRTASASEILAGALRDNGRAQLVGDAPTYGKGRIQSVYQLPDGAALFVTVARYQTPARSDIDQVGILPPGCEVHSATRASTFDELMSMTTSDDDDCRSTYLWSCVVRLAQSPRRSACLRIHALSQPARRCAPRWCTPQACHARRACRRRAPRRRSSWSPTGCASKKSR